MKYEIIKADLLLLKKKGLYVCYCRVDIAKS